MRVVSVRVLALYLVAQLFCGSACSLESDLTLQQLNHKGWTAANGAPGNVVAIAQTPDGTLWVASEMGLFRFDGLTFVRYAGTDGQQPFATNLSALATSPNGDLWIGSRFGGVGVLSHGRFTRYGEAEGLPTGTVMDIVWDRGGTTWVATRGGVARLRGARWDPVTLDASRSVAPYGALIDRSGTLWVLTADRALARKPGTSQFQEIAKRTFAPNSATMALAGAPDGTVWMSDPAGLTRMDSITSASRTWRHIDEGPLLFDRDGNLWLGGGGVRRLSSGMRRTGETNPGALRPEIFGKADGLTSTRVISLFEDREGNIWAGTSLGLDRFSRSNVVRFAPPAARGMDPLAGPVVVPAGANAIWIATSTIFPSGHLFEVRNCTVIAEQAAPGFSSGYRDIDGSVWFGGPTGIGHMQGARLVMRPLPEEARGLDVQAIARDREGALWISVIRKGVFRLSGEEWVPYGGLRELPRLTAIVETVDVQGRLWFGYTGDRIARVEGSTVRLFGVEDGLRVGNVTALEVHRGHVWVGGELGLARLDGNHFVSVHGDPDGVLSGITGIIETEKGELWLNGNKGVFRISPVEVDESVRDANHPVSYEAFDYLDGLPGMAVQLRPIPSALETTAGGLWFVTTNGLASIDTARIRHNPLPPPVTIWSVVAGGQRYPIVSSGLRNPLRATKLQIEYTAGSLTIPERVRFRYKLDGLDSEWQDAGSRREAFYTNLAPGDYVFHVIASNNDGVWNTKGASVMFTISPAFYQTLWFRALCALAFAMVLWLVFTLRVRQIRAKVRGRLRERLAERERIARELHDTLLQGLEGLVLRFQAVYNRIPRYESARELMERALESADQVLEEGRDRVLNLRSSARDPGDLPQALAAAGEQYALTHPAQFKVKTAGVLREIDPIVREEMWLIGREALANAFRHAGASKIEVLVSYGKHVFRLQILDDGRGIDPDVLKHGRPGHLGLEGMRERAVNIRARLGLWSEPGMGTQIDVLVPAERAYRNDTRTGPLQGWTWAGALNPGRRSERSSQGATERNT